MKKPYYLLIAATLLLTGVNLTSCDSQVQGTLTIQGNNHVGINEYLQLSAYFNDAKNEDVVWSSSNVDVATVSSSGIVKGLKVGKTTITASLKENSEIKSTQEVEVHESFELNMVYNRFRNNSYKVASTGSFSLNGTEYDLSFEEKYFSNSYSFVSQSKNFENSFGYGEDFDTIVYKYSLNDNVVSNAEFIRDEVYGYRRMTYDLDDLGISAFASYQLRDDNTYLIGEDLTKQVFLSMIVQNFKTDNQANIDAARGLVNALNSLTIKVLTPTSFETIFDFNDNKVTTLKFETIAEKNEALNTYLLSNDIGKPVVEKDLLRLKELVKNHNYTRHLGYYNSEETKIEIGTAYYTEDYMYYDFTEEYIAYFNAHPQGEKKVLNDYGYVNIEKDVDNEHKGPAVYYFEYKDVDGQMQVVLGEKYVETDSLVPTKYTKYYEFFENATWIMEYVDHKLFTFQPTSTNDFANKENYKEYMSNSLTAADITYYLFQDYVLAFDATPLGLFMAYSDSAVDSECELYVGGYMYISGSAAYIYQTYSYTGFNTSSVTVMEEYLQSLKS